MKNNMCRKGLVCAIFVLFVGISIMPIAGSLSIERISTEQICKTNSDDDTTPPVTTISFDPPTPTGENGWYVDYVEITLEATDDMSGVDFIKYLLDDSDWLTYTSPLIIESDGYHRITYYAVDKAGNVEQPSEVLRFKIDRTDPQIEKFVMEPYKENWKWYVTFTVKCSDAMSGMDRVEFYINDGLAFTDDEEPYVWTIEWPDAIENLYVLAFDKAGNSDYDDYPEPVPYWSVNGLICNPEFSRQNVGPSLLPSTGSIVAEKYVSTDNQICESNSRNDNDTTPPVTTISFDLPYPDGDNGWYVSDVTVTLNATDDISGVDVIKYLLDDSDWLTYTGPFTVESDGYHRITYYAIDKAGNVEQPSEVIRFGIDQTPPTIELTWEVHGNFIQGWEVTFFVTCYDEISVVDRLEIYLDDELLFTDDSEPYECIMTFKWSSALKNSIFKACASDSAGHLGCETVHLSEINPYPNSQSRQQSSTGSTVVKKATMPTSYDGNTLYVGGSGPGNYTRIQDAIDDASDGDTVFVYDDSSPYYENVVIDKSAINLIGENKETTIIDGSGNDDVILIEGNGCGVTVSGFTIQNSGNDIWDGVGIDVHTRASTISGNIITNNSCGIYCCKDEYPYWFGWNIISDNIITNNRVDGIVLDTLYCNWVYENYIANNGQGIFVGSSILPSKRGACLLDEYYNNIYRNTITNNSWDGVEILVAFYTNVFENNITNNKNGIGLFAPYLTLCDNNSIYGNNIMNNENGIEIMVGSFIGYASVENNKIYQNDMINNEKGIKITVNDGNFVTANDNKIYQNNITNSDKGIEIIVGNGFFVNVNDNEIYHNNFFNNTQNAYDEGRNQWDNGSAGNYWDDYSGIDILPPYGIGDLPYNIPPRIVYNKDRYPLMGPWPDPYPYNNNEVTQNSNSQGNNVQQSSNPLFFQILGRLLNTR